jgi:hypothetical protein
MLFVHPVRDRMPGANLIRGMDVLSSNPHDVPAQSAHSCEEPDDQP